MEFLPIISIIITLVGLITEYLIIHFKVISGILDRLTKLETQMSPFWKIIECEIPKLIHSPHTPDIDVLLEKMSDRKISIEEMKDLKCKLGDEIVNPNLKKELLFKLFLARLEQMIDGDKFH